jgi:hypothetical protein
MDRVKELETAIEKAIEWLGANSTPCVTNARQVLRAALTPAEKVPLTCPKCGRTLLNNTTTWWCQNGPCSWQQSDKAQRPKMPERCKAGHHYEWRQVQNGDSFVTPDGILIENANVRNLANPPKRWIAVKDVPVSESQKGNKPMKPTEADKRDGLKRKYNIEHADGTGVDRDAEYFVLRLDFHEGCDTTHVNACRAAIRCYAQNIKDHLPKLSEDLFRKYGNDAPVSEPVPVCQSCNILGRQCTLPSGHEGAHSVTETIAVWNDPPPSPVKVPVVSGCRLPTKEEIDWCVNNLTSRNPQFDADLSLGEKALAITTVWIASIGGVYESARKPAKPAIEPLGNYPTAKQMRDKMQEVIARVNALEGGGK